MNEIKNLKVATSTNVYGIIDFINIKHIPKEDILQVSFIEDQWYLFYYAKLMPFKEEE